jgi:hypothetical protein
MLVGNPIQNEWFNSIIYIFLINAHTNGTYK